MHVIFITFIYDTGPITLAQVKKSTIAGIDYDLKQSLPHIQVLIEINPTNLQGDVALMKKGRILFLAFMLLLAGCQAATPDPVPTNTAILPTPTTEPTLEPTVEVVVQIDQCVSCHTDKEQLIATAKPEEEVEGESSGVG